MHIQIVSTRRAGTFMQVGGGQTRRRERDAEGRGLEGGV